MVRWRLVALAGWALLLASAGVKAFLPGTGTGRHRKKIAPTNNEKDLPISAGLRQKAVLTPPGAIHTAAQSVPESTDLPVQEDPVNAVPDTEESEKGSSIAAATFSLIKVIVGSGLLALPAGLAAMSDYPISLIPANILLLVLGALSAYTFSLYGRLTHATQAKSLGELWMTIQQETSQGATSQEKKPMDVMSIASLIYCTGCCLMFSLVIGDAVSSLIQAALSGAAPWWASRQASIVAVTSALLWPLSNLSSLSALVPFSLIGVIGTLLTTLFVAWRCPTLVPSSPYAKVGAGFLTLKSGLQGPTFRTYNRILSPAPLVLIAMGCVALMAHFSAPDLYHSLADKTNEDGTTALEPPQQTNLVLKKYNRMTAAAYLSVAVINAAVLSFGFLTFGGNVASILLNSYATNDWGAAVSRLLIVISVIGGFPFLLTAARSAAIDLFATRKKKSENKRAQERKITAILLSIVTGTALVIEDAGFVVSFNGALMGSAIIYTFPALLFLKHSASRIGTSKRLYTERWFCRFLVGFGIVSSVVGGVTSVLNSYFPHLLR